MNIHSMKWNKILVILLFMIFSIPNSILGNNFSIDSIGNLPQFNPISEIHITVNTNQTINISAINALLIQSGSIPDFVTFQSLGNGNAELMVSPNENHIGDYSIILWATNNFGTASVTIQLKVYPDNNTPLNPPIFNPINDILISRDTNMTVGIFAAYANQIEAHNIPDFMTFTNQGFGSSSLFINSNNSHAGNYSLQFIALGPDGKDTLDLRVLIENIIPPPTQEGRCELAQVFKMSSHPNFENLFNEQIISGDPSIGPGGNPFESWLPTYDSTEFPIMGYLDLGSPQDLTRVFIRDINGDGIFKIYTGTSPNNINTSPIVTDNLTGWMTWNEHPLNTVTQYLFFEMSSPTSNVAEILVYGYCTLEIDTIPPNPITDLSITNITASTATLNWSGDAEKYDLRYSTAPITSVNFENLTSWIIENPTVTGTNISHKIPNLNCNENYYFAIKAIDNAENISSISNIVTDSTLSCNSNITLTITFDSVLTSIPNIDLARLRYNKDFAYSITFDDGSWWEYNITYPILNGGMTPDGEIQNGYFYTDGCGNDEKFRASIAINGNTILETPYGTNFMTWENVKEMFQNDWDVLNHSFTHCAYGCDYEREVIANDSMVLAKLDFQMTHFAIPSGDNDGYRLPAFNNGQVAVHGQSYLMQGEGGLQVDQSINLFELELFRNTLEIENLPFGEDIDNVAALTQSGNHYWMSEYAHRIGYPGDPYIFIYVDDFKEYMNYIENSFGRFGEDNVWFAPVQEVYEYIQVRDNIQISSTQTIGNQMIVTFDSSSIPEGLRRNTLSLLLDLSLNNTLNISNIEATNSNLKFNSEGLINLDW